VPREASELQGVIKSYDPDTREGAIITDTDRAGYDLAKDALAGSIFRMLRPGQRVVFDLDGDGRATKLRLGSEVDMGAPAPPPGINADADTTDEVEA
jgi:CspA family cold shock protein